VATNFSIESTTDEASPPIPPPKRRFLLFRRLLAIIAVLVVVSLVAAAIYVGSLSKSFTNSLHHEDILPPPVVSGPRSSSTGTKEAVPTRPAKGATKAVDYVLMGSDSRDPGDAQAGRSDSLMVLHLAADRKSAYLVSFPRDMYVAIPGYGRNKINAAFSFGGPVLAVETLEQLLGTRMDHVALIDFDGFIELTEALGGVTVYNKHASKSRGYDFPAGDITIQGDRALAFVRERYELPNGDLDRAERQRMVVKAILEKGLSPEVIANPAKFTSFVSGIAEHLTVDDQLGNGEIRTTALSLRLGANDISLLQAPISGFATVRGMSIDVVDGAKMAALANDLQNDTMADYVKKYPKS
jgi:polyisoprenyl-teichoic acid--peptidoglycan teichoic acid transferase